MSIQSSINSLLATSAVLTKLAQPNINAKILAKEKGQDAQSFHEFSQKRIAEAEKSGLAPDKIIDMLSGQAAYDEDYLSSLQALHEMSPGNTALSNQYLYARSAATQYHANKVAKTHEFINDKAKLDSELKSHLDKASQSISTRENILGRELTEDRDTLRQLQEQYNVEHKLYNDLSTKYQTYRNQALGMATRGVIKNG